MAWTISPDSYDVVVVGSGLPECLVAASLLKSGKSVLIIDAVDTYGTDFASFTPAALVDILAQQQPFQNPPTALSEPAATDSTSIGTGLASTPAHSSEEHEHSLPACVPVSQPLPQGCRLLRLRQRPLPLSGIRALAAPGEGGGPAERRGYILDLVPKLVYQSEPLVDLLVRCRCHHYLEFKAVEGSYLLQDGALQPVPAARSDIFRDRRLGLADKRLLMRFIQGCVEARSGQGHLKEALSSATRSLAQILAEEGLPPRLREVILYGIAMCDADQEPPPSAAATTPQGAVGRAEGAESAAGSGGVLTGAGGGAALELFTSSQGRFGHESAFMLPSYGSGSVAEAFVRLCAVHGAVTVLRQPVQALLVGPTAPATTAATAQYESTEAVVGVEEAAAASAASPSDSCVGIVTAAGQVVRCGVVVAGTGTLSCLEGAEPLTPPEYVSRGAVVLDGPLMPGTHGSTAAPQHQVPKSLLTLVVPPRCQALTATGAAAAADCAGASDGAAIQQPSGGLGNPHPVRVLQQGATTCVCSAGRFLVYLSTPATSDSSYNDLWPTLQCLADTSALRDVSSGAASTTAAAAPADDDGPATATATPDSKTAGPAPGPPASSPRPRVLRAWFYRQPVLSGAADAASATAIAGAGAGGGGAASHSGSSRPRLPGGVVALPGPDGSLAGYSRVLKATEAAYRSAFPEAKWLSEAEFGGGQVGGSSEGGKEDGQEGGGRAEALGDDGDDAVIEELTAALARLKDG